VDSLSELRDSVHKITISLSDPLITLPQIEGPTELLSEETEGRQRRFVVRGDAQQVVKLWEGRTGVQQIQARPATLDELFVACTRGIPSKLEFEGKQSSGDTAAGDTAAGRQAS
jgi:ABC-2 type transport system ATP-binding protein